MTDAQTGPAAPAAPGAATAPPPGAAHRVDEVDFLSRPMRANGVVREGRSFRVDEPWAPATFTRVTLSKGWWAFDCDGDSDGVAIRVRHDGGLLFSCHARDVSTLRLRLGESVVADIDLIISPWPGRAAFTQLRLRRLSAVEAIGLLARRGAGLLRSDKPFTRAAAAARLLVSGRSFGARRADAGPAHAHNGGQGGDAPASAPGVRLIDGGGFTAILHADDTLDARTLPLVRDVFARQPGVEAIYGDVIEGGCVHPKPQWDSERARWDNFAGLPVFLRGAFAGDAAAAWERLKAIAAASGAAAIHRVALPLARRAAPAPCAPLPKLPTPVIARPPRVSVIIPTKHRVDLLERCLEGLHSLTDYPDLEVVVIDNGSRSAQLRRVLQWADERMRLVSLYDGGDFNFSRLINFGARSATGDVLLVLNDDVHPFESGWLHRMVASVMEPGTGAVGARLLYASGDVQHAGVAMGLGGICGHVYRHTSGADAASNPAIVYPGRRLALTGACLAVRRKVFEQVGGLNETSFPVTLNDIDFCLRLHKAGFANIYRGDAVLFHEESQSRGDDNLTPERRRRRNAEIRDFRHVWGDLIVNDPFGSPAFDPATETGAASVPRFIPGDDQV